jgi:hypothetical protein
VDKNSEWNAIFYGSGAVFAQDQKAWTEAYQHPAAPAGVTPKVLSEPERMDLVSHCVERPVLRLFGVKEPDPEDPLPLSVANYIRECAQIDFYPSIVCLSPTADGEKTEVSFFLPAFQRGLARLKARKLMELDDDLDLQLEAWNGAGWSCVELDGAAVLTQ